MDSKDQGIRIDKWLWAARFFKTRSLASKAVNGGRVHINEARVKSSRTVHVGDVVQITKGELEWHVAVLALNAQRRPAAEARLLYEESEESKQRRHHAREMRKMFHAGHSAPAGKPDKRDRRKIREFIRKK